jgi:aminoglycoside 3-N-acetyltransferase
MPPTINRASLVADLRSIGLRSGDKVMVHSSFKSLGIREPETIIQALLVVLGENGTLLLPALSYLQQPPLVHDTRTTPTCVGYLTEYFRTRPGVTRSLHPTHSVCAIGASVDELLGDHGADATPCGEHSPFHKLLHRSGRILMLGCGLRPNTTMHAIEEYARPPYLFGDPLIYTITDANGHIFQKQYVHHGFKGYAQRYDRAEAVLDAAQLRRGMVGNASSYLIDSHALHTQALVQLRSDPFYFVEPKPQV